MSNILKKNNILDTEDNYNTENKGAKEALLNLLNKLPSLSAEQWSEIFELMDSNSIGGKINVKEAYVVAFSKMLLGYAIEINYMFAQYKKEFYIFNTQYWIKIEPALLIHFFKAAANKIGIPQYIASSVTFINKLLKQFIQDAYFEELVLKDSTCINLQNGILNISKNGVQLEEHHPKYFLTYILDFEYIENSNNDNFIKLLNNIIPSIEIQKTLQQSISQILVKNTNNDKKICLYGLNRVISSSFINIFKEVIPQDVISNYLNNENSKLEDLFIDYENVSKDTKSLEKIIFIPCQIILENTNDIQEIKKNKSEVFNWLIKGVKEIIKTKKIYISKECEDFKERFNFVNLFVKETNLIKTENNSKSIVTTYENVLKQYELFCELYDEEPLGRGYFNRELKALGFEATRRGTGNVWFAKFA
ncbi:hypothetical protein NG752_10140 [Aliarcobacter cryaerophilus]|uniref:hypothetical protein n=1 Tax=Aliarcobacter cryaerophilus TaxID=28198 RepID=UPI003DA5A568